MRVISAALAALLVSQVGHSAVADIDPLGDVDPCWLEASPTPLVAVLKTFRLPIRLDQPEADARLRMTHGDMRLLGVGGIGIGYPGLGGIEDVPILCALGGRYIEGTSDGIEGVEHAQLMEAFRLYAAEYNSVILAWYRNQEDKSAP